MNNSIEIFGIIFPNLWLFILVFCYFIFYIIANIIPSFVCLYKCITDEDDWKMAPLYFIFCLVPFIGTIFSALFCDFYFDKNKILENLIIILTYIIVICFIGCLFNL